MIRAWILRNIVADDPHPLPSALDALDHPCAPAPPTLAQGRSTQDARPHRTRRVSTGATDVTLSR